jgi:hypothetical protein
MIKAKYYPKTNTIEYNGQKFAFSSFIIPPINTHKEGVNPIPTISKPELEEEEIYRAAPGSGAFWFNLIGFIVLACFAGTMSGLTVGYLSIDSLILEIKMSNGTESEKY